MRCVRYHWCDSFHANGRKQPDVRFMVDANAYKMIHSKDGVTNHQQDDSNLIPEDYIGTNEALLLQLPRTIEGFHMHEKRWSKYGIMWSTTHSPERKMLTGQ